MNGVQLELSEMWNVTVSLTLLTFLEVGDV